MRTKSTKSNKTFYVGMDVTENEIYTKAHTSAQNAEQDVRKILLEDAEEGGFGFEEPLSIVEIKVLKTLQCKQQNVIEEL